MFWSSILLFITLLACSQPVSPPDGEVFTTGPGNKVEFKVETVASGLEVPWAFAWLPNGDLIFTERRGRVRIIQNGQLRAELFTSFPTWSLLAEAA